MMSPMSLRNDMLTTGWLSLWTISVWNSNTHKIPNAEEDIPLGVSSIVLGWPSVAGDSISTVIMMTLPLSVPTHTLHVGVWAVREVSIYIHTFIHTHTHMHTHTHTHAHTLSRHYTHSLTMFVNIQLYYTDSINTQCRVVPFTDNILHSLSISLHRYCSFCQRF